MLLDFIRVLMSVKGEAMENVIVVAVLAAMAVGCEVALRKLRVLASHVRPLGPPRATGSLVEGRPRY